MRRLGVLAAASVACAAAGAAALAPPPQPRAAPLSAKAKTGPRNLALSLILSRGHEVLTVLIQNRGPGPICIDPNYPASVRLSAFAKAGKPIASLSQTPGRSKAVCARLAPRKTIHVVYDLRPLYPLGLPGTSRLCYGAWWRTGGPDSKTQTMQSARCLVLPSTGLGVR